MRGALNDVVGGGFTRNGEGGCCELRGRERLQEWLRTPSITPCYDQGTSSKFSGDLADLCQRSRSEDDAGGCGEFEAHAKQRVL